MKTPYFFGSKAVTKSERTHAVAGVFASVAERYDLMNDLMSVGLHRLWKQALVNLAAPRPQETWLDLATGSGDIAALLAAPHRVQQVIAVDANAAMLAQAQANLGDLTKVKFSVAAAEELPFATASFAGVTCAFGVRNFTEPTVGIAEMARVLAPGGRAVILEFAPPIGTGFKAQLQRQYLLQILPVLGGIVVDDEVSYQYLAESIINFAPPQQVMTWLTDAGLVEAEYSSFAGGVVGLYRAWKTW